MIVDTDPMVSMKEVNQNFYRAAEIVHKNGSAVILKNNVHKYIVLEYKPVETDANISDNELLTVSKKLY